MWFVSKTRNRTRNWIAYPYMLSHTICSRNVHSSGRMWWTAASVMTKYARTQCRKHFDLILITTIFIIINVSLFFFFFFYRQFVIGFTSFTSCAELLMVSLMILNYFRPIPNVPWYNYSLTRSTKHHSKRAHQYTKRHRQGCVGFHVFSFVEETFCLSSCSQAHWLFLKSPSVSCFSLSFLLRSL